MIKYRLLLVCFVLFGTTVFGQLEWEVRAPLPQYGRAASAVFSLNGMIYCGLGHFANGTSFNDFWVYDIQTDRWSRIANYPDGQRIAPLSFSIGSKGYVGLGDNGATMSSKLYEYDPSTNVWTQKASFPGNARYGMASFTIGDTLYMGGGSCGGTTCYYDDFWRYIPSTNTWTQIASWPGGKRLLPTGFSIGSFGYVGNGINATYTPSNIFYKYSPNTNSWTTIASLPGSARSTTLAFVINNEAYVGTGFLSVSVPVNRKNSFYKYSPGSNSWTFLSSNNNFPGVSDHSIVTEGNSNVFCIGGVDSNGHTSANWQLKLEVDTFDYFDTTFVQDTMFHVVYDTVTTYTYDTIIRYINVLVEDTLNFTVYTDDCGNVIHKIYPNPSSDWVYVYSNNVDCYLDYNLELVTSLGQVLQLKKYENLVSFNMRGYAAGLYFVRLRGGSGDVVFSKKVMIN
jgi:N-acetylneuraminic acid mutarotase